MMKTALFVLQQVRKRLNLSALTSIESAGDPDELQQIEILQAVSEELRQYACWPQQKRYYTFDTVSGVSSYQLPADFYTPLNSTHYNQDDSFPLIGPLSDGEFSNILYGNEGNSRNFSYRIFGADQNSASAGGQFKVDPAPDSAVTLSFEYISRHLFLPKNWIASTAYTSGVYVNANGNIYLCDTNGTSSSTTAPTGTTANITDGTTQWDYVSAPYELALTDTDLCIFDYDLLKLGVRAKWIEEKGGDYAAAKYEYETKRDQAIARIKGAVRGSFAKSSPFQRYRVQYRNWSL